MHIGQYIQIVLKKKNMSSQDLVNRINELHLCNGKIYKNAISEMLNGNRKITKKVAEKMEVALNLPESSLTELIKVR